jgi:hypothetical protein
MSIRHPFIPSWASDGSLQRVPVAAVLWVSLFAPLAATGASRLAFVTSTGGTGIFGQWSGAGGNTGLAAGDAICVARATAADLPDPQSFVAWLSDSNNDAYCRVHGLSGKKSANCGQTVLPTGAGPWRRTDGVPFLGALTGGSPMATVYSPLARDEFTNTLTDAMLFTGTLADGTASARLCGDWVVPSSTVNFGDTNSTDPEWTNIAGYAFCDGFAPGHLACMQKGAGDPLRTPTQTHKQAFLTSLNFNGNLGNSAQAGGNTGLAAGDAICRNLAHASNLQEADSYKVYLAEDTPPSTRFQYDGPWERLDGLTFADSFAQINSGYVRVPLNMMESGAYAQGGNRHAWSGFNTSGVSAQNCTHWTLVTSGAWISSLDTVGPHWPMAVGLPTECTAGMALFCLSDSDLLFRYGME